MLKLSWMHWLSLLTLFLISSCASPTGPAVTLCSLDYANSGFQCANKKSKYFLTFEAGQALYCAKPEDCETFFKGCKAHQLLPLTTCEISHDYMTLKCFPPDGGLIFSIPIQQGDGYLCLSEQDYTRISQRCE